MATVFHGKSDSSFFQSSPISYHTLQAKFHALVFLNGCTAFGPRTSLLRQRSTDASSTTVKQMTYEVRDVFSAPSDWVVGLIDVGCNACVQKSTLNGSSNFRYGFFIPSRSSLVLIAGAYTVVVSTYDPGIIGKYRLTMQSQIKLSLTSIPAEGAVSLLILICTGLASVYASGFSTDAISCFVSNGVVRG